MAKDEEILNQFKQEAGETAEIDASKKVRIGIIGTGGIAKNHIRSYLKMPDVEIVAVADLVPGRAEAFLKDFGVEGATCYPDHKSMLEHEKLDAVSVCTYNRTHAECAIAALKKGVHVLLEKPMSVTLEEAADIIRAEKESGKILTIGFQPRMDGNMQMIKKIVQSGELGKIYYIQTGGGRRHGIPVGNDASFIREDTAGIGAMGDIGCYSLDMVLNAVGYPKPLTVTGYVSDFFGKNPDFFPGHPEYAQLFGVDDFAAGFIRLEGDIVLDFRISWAMHMDTTGDTIILGTKGGLKIPSTQCWNGSTGGPMTIFHDVAGERVETVIPLVESGDFRDLFDRKIRSFLDAVKNGTPAPVPSSQIFYNQAIIDGIVKSAKLGHEIKLELPEL